MAMIYDLMHADKSGVDAMQCAQRDWSPYLVHFTKAGAMGPIREMLFKKWILKPSQVKRRLKVADKSSFDMAKKIIESGMLKKSVIQTKETDPCVCLSECTLPGLIGHSERYGRFGFVFKKNDIFKLGGRPCVYFDDEAYAELNKSRDSSEVLKKMWGFANLYRPLDKIQDFSHEREWRVFDDVSITSTNLVAILVPENYVKATFELVRARMTDIIVPIMSIDMLYAWGA